MLAWRRPTCSTAARSPISTAGTRPRSTRTSLYCVPRIRGAMLDELRTMDWVPRLVRSKQSKVDAACKAMEAALGRKPTLEELSTKLGVPQDQQAEYAFHG